MFYSSAISAQDGAGGRWLVTAAAATAAIVVVTSVTITVAVVAAVVAATTIADTAIAAPSIAVVVVAAAAVAVADAKREAIVAVLLPPLPPLNPAAAIRNNHPAPPLNSNDLPHNLPMPPPCHHFIPISAFQRLKMLCCDKILGRWGRVRISWSLSWGGARVVSPAFASPMGVE